MEKRNRNIMTIGALTILSVIIFFTLLYYLLGNPLFRGGTDVIVRMENGAGLKRSDRVQLQGVDVGSVRSIELSTRASGVIVELRIDDGLALPTDTRALVRGDVFGAHTVALVPGNSMKLLADEDTIVGITAPELTAIASSLSARAESLLSAADSLLAPATVQDLRETAAILPTSAIELRAALAEARAAGASLRRSMQELEDAKAGPALGSAIQQVDQSARSIARASDNIATASQTLNTSLERFNSVMAKVDRGNGTLGLLVNDSSLYVEFNETLREIRALATDIRERPNRYIDLRLFGH
jgi:phospholipid/cholesterol/gamma-HCH transport system substrate-binding protein